MFRTEAVREAEATRRQDGFTMIEIAVVLLILAIVAAFVVPQILNHMRAYRLGVGARNVATALQRARFLATSDNTRAMAVVSENTRVDIQEYVDEAATQLQNKGIVIMPEGVSIVPAGPRSVAFDGRGIVTPMPNENAVFRINGANGYYMLVTVSPTGQVTLSDSKLEAR